MGPYRIPSESGHPDPAFSIHHSEDLCSLKSQPDRGPTVAGVLHTDYSGAHLGLGFGVQGLRWWAEGRGASNDIVGTVLVTPSQIPKNIPHMSLE